MPATEAHYLRVRVPTLAVGRTQRFVYIEHTCGAIVFADVVRQ